VTDPEDDYGYFAPTWFDADREGEATPATPTILKLTYRWSIKVFGERIGFFLGDLAVDIYYRTKGRA
jgi:hypothetical protein